MRTHWIAWALTLGFALTVLAGPIASAYDVDRTPITQDGTTGAWLERAGDPILPTDGCRCNGSDTVTIGVIARWGYLNDPAVAGLEGRWRWTDNHTGDFLGMWHLVDRRIGGYLMGDFRLPDDGQGGFRGRWNYSGSSDGGFLWGAWVRLDAFHGSFDGMWNFSDGRDGGALAGAWAVFSRDGGGFVGRGVAAPSIHPVDWDGFLGSRVAGVRLLRTIRFEPGDFVHRQWTPHLLEWDSTTTVNWDGLLMAVVVPKDHLDANVTLHAGPATYTWTARELATTHVRETVDRAGHEIEVRGFLLERHRDGDYARISVGIRWGFLAHDGYDRPDRNATDWSGGARISDGGLGVYRTLSFERGDYLGRRDNRQSVPWTSHTTTGWDGVILIALVPLDHIDDAHFALRAGAFHHVFTLRELAGHHVFDVDRAGHQVEIRAVRL